MLSLLRLRLAQRDADILLAMHNRKFQSRRLQVGGDTLKRVVPAWVEH